MFRSVNPHFAAAMALLAATTAQAQLLPFNNATPQQLVQNMLAGQGVNVSNITFNGQPATAITDQVGSFNGTASNIGLDSGIAICTGNVMLIQGPNMLGGATDPAAFPSNTPDPDLAYFTSGQHSVAALEFDFIPTGDSISFRFVFGSEEYPEYVCTSYNDAFGFFLSGPGINGPFTNQAVNLALVPGTNIPVAINTVNPGVPGAFGGNATTCAGADPNWQSNSIYYTNNPVDPNPFNPTTTVELDGFTVPIRAQALVQCGQTYHIKMVICNGTDGSLDSAVLIEGGSFSSEGSIAVTATTPLGDGILTEGCGEAMVTVARPAGGSAAQVQLVYSGVGITSGDLDGALDEVTIPDGATEVSFPISAVRDSAAEGSETLAIIATWVSQCGFTATDTFMLALQDYVPMSLAVQDVHLNCDVDSVLLQAQTSGGLGLITLGWGSTAAPEPFFATGWEDGIYTVTATDQCPESMEAVVQVHSGCTVWIPNVITPNGDGVNDAWVINGMGRSGCAVKVYNRWGNMVYSAGNYGNNWKAKDLPDGTYFYEVVDGRTDKRYTGHLTVLANGRK